MLKTTKYHINIDQYKDKEASEALIHAKPLDFSLAAHAQYTTPNTTSHETYKSLISKNEIQSILNNKPKNKAAGHDTLPYEAFKYAH